MKKSKNVKGLSIIKRPVKKFRLNKTNKIHLSDGQKFMEIVKIV